MLSNRAREGAVDDPRARPSAIHRLRLTNGTPSAVAVLVAAEVAVHLAGIRYESFHLASTSGGAGGHIRRAVRSVFSSWRAPLAQHRRSFVRRDIEHKAINELRVFVVHTTDGGAMPFGERQGKRRAVVCGIDRREHAVGEGLMTSGDLGAISMQNKWKA